MNGEFQWITHTTERTNERGKKGYVTGQCLAWGKTQLGYYKNLFLRKAFEEGLQPQGRKSLEARPPGSCTNRAVWSWMKQEQVALHRCGMPYKQHFPPGNFPISALPDRKHCLTRTNRTAATTEARVELCSPVVSPTMRSQMSGRERSTLCFYSRGWGAHVLYLLRSLAENLHSSSWLSFEVHPEVGQFPSCLHRHCRHLQPQTCVCSQQSSRNDTSSSLEAYNGWKSLSFSSALDGSSGRDNS